MLIVVKKHVFYGLRDDGLERTDVDSGKKRDIDVFYGLRDDGLERTDVDSGKKRDIDVFLRTAR